MGRKKHFPNYAASFDFLKFLLFFLLEMPGKAFRIYLVLAKSIKKIRQMNKTILQLIIIGIFSLVGDTALAQKSGSNIFEDILKETNTFRTSNGLAPLTARLELTKMAQEHSDDMAKGLVPFGHEGFNNRQQNLVKQMNNLKAFGENVAFGPTTGKEAVKGWENSPPHRRNMLGNFKYIGIGIASDKNGRLYYTQFFAG